MSSKLILLELSKVYIHYDLNCIPDHITGCLCWDGIVFLQHNSNNIERLIRDGKSEKEVVGQEAGVGKRCRDNCHKEVLGSYVKLRGRHILRGYYKRCGSLPRCRNQAITMCWDEKLEMIHGTVKGDGIPGKSGVFGARAAG